MLSFLCANCGGIQELIPIVLALLFGSTAHPKSNFVWFDIPHMYLSSTLGVTHGVSEVSKWVSVEEEDGLSPPRRRERHDSSPDASPPRRRRHDSPDVSPPRRRERHDSRPDTSPLRRRRHDSLDVSPPRRRERHDSSPDASPPRRRRHDSPDVSPPRRRERHDSRPDTSPPRRKKYTYDASPPRHHRHEDSDRKPSKYDDEVYRRKPATGERTASGYKAGLQSSGDFKQVGNNSHKLVILAQSPYHCLVLLLNFSLSTPQLSLSLSLVAMTHFSRFSNIQGGRGNSS